VKEKVSHVNRDRKLKLQLEVKWFVAIFLVTIITILILARLVSVVLIELYQTVAEYSSENVAIQLSSLLSVSASAPYKIFIGFKPSREVLYDVSSKGKTLTVEAKFKQPYIQRMPYESKFCTNFQDFSFSDVNEFLIEKSLAENGKSDYKISVRRSYK